MLRGQIFVSVSDNESVPLVPGPPGVWHAASDVAILKHNCKLKKRDSIPLMQVGSWESKVPRCGWGKAPVGALITINQVTNFSMYNNSITKIGKYKQPVLPTVESS